MSKGYGPITRNNLVVTLGFLGKMTENTNIHYKCNIEGVIEGIASKGVFFIKPPKFPSELLQGTTWKLENMLS